MTDNEETNSEYDYHEHQDDTCHEDAEENVSEFYDYLENQDDLAGHEIEIVQGDKDGSKWLFLDDIYILHKKEETVNAVFWECSGRRRFNCKFKCATIEGEDGLEMSFMYKLEIHSCGQSKLGPIIHKFKNSLKEEMRANYKASFSKVFEMKRNELMRKYSDQPDILERINYELKDKRSYRNLAERAKNKCFPKIPKSHAEINLADMNLQHIELARSSHPDPEVKDKDIFLLGTHTTAEAFANAEFKSGDGTLKITPKLFYQTFVLMALYGGVYVPCLFGLLPDKTAETYDRFFAMLWAYNDKHKLPNNFANQFFMCDFEVAIRSSVMLYWPSVSILGCFFHFSQIVWRKIKKAGYQVSYEKNDKFNALMRRCSSLPFVKKDDLTKAFKIFENRADDLEDDKLKEFSKALIEYLNAQWRHGVYAVQDWNLYDLNLLLVPSTNNGNEGQNRRFKENMGVHPKFWDFLLTLNSEIETRSSDIPLILLGSLIPAQDDNYHSLKVEREIAKANLEAGLLSLDSYMGKIGALSIKAGKAKNVDDADDDFSIPKRRTTKKASGSSSNPDGNIPGHRGRRAVIPPPPKSSSTSTASAVPSLSVTSTSLVSSMPVLGSNVMIASSNQVPRNLPWPSSVGIVPPVPSLPSTASRTTASAVPPVLTTRQAARNPVTELSAVSRSNDSLIAHIAKNNLGLKQRPLISGDGNCWYSSCLDLVTLLGIPGGFQDVHELRLAVTNRISSHPNKREWIRSLFGGRARAFNKFVKEQSKEGAFVDDSGIAVLVTSEVLDVVIHIVGTSNNAENPVTVIGNPSDDKIVFHIGYYQDTTDIAAPGTRAFKAGHYQSLEASDGRTPKCCESLGSTNPSSSITCLDSSPAPPVDSHELSGKIINEEKILSLLKTDAQIVESCLDRLKHLKPVTIDDLFRTNICNVLFNDIKPLYSTNTQNGRKCRLLLKYYQRVCRSHPDFDNDDLPELTDIEDDDEVHNQHKPQKNFRDLFTGRKRTSNVLSEVFQSMSPSVSMSIPISSSTLVDPPRVSLASNPVSILPEMSVSFWTSDDHHETAPRPKKPRGRPPKATETTKRGRGRPPKELNISDTDEETQSVCLTPPPPVSPATPKKKRGRGRSRKNGS